MLVFLAGGSLRGAARADTLWVDGQRTACATPADTACCSDDRTRADVASRDAGHPAAVAWCSIERAVSDPELQPGDTIMVRGGTYGVRQSDSGSQYSPFDDRRDHCDMRPRTDGRSGQPITLRNFNNEVVTVDGRWPIPGTWQRCDVTGSGCPSEIQGVARHTTWWIAYGWSERFPYGSSGMPAGWAQGQFWDGETFVPSLSSTDLQQFNQRAGFWAQDAINRRLYYRPLAGAEDAVGITSAEDPPPPWNATVRFAGCAGFFSTDGHHGWTVDGLRFVGAAGVALLINKDAATRQQWSYDIAIRHTVVTYSGNNACTPSRDGSYGHALLIQGGSARLGRIDIEGNEFAESVAENVHVGSGCDQIACGERVVGNLVRDAARDRGWDSACAAGVGAFGEEHAPGLIVRSDGGLYDANRIIGNDGEGLSLESDGMTGGEPESAPSRVTVSRNVVAENSGTGILGTCINDHRPSKGNRIYDNVLMGNARNGLRSGALHLEGACASWLLLNNSIAAVPSVVGNGSAVVMASVPCGNSCTPRGMMMINNALSTTSNGPAAIWCQRCGFLKPPSHNLYDAGGRDPIRIGSRSVPRASIGRANLVADPEWDPTTLQPRDGSPLLGAGLSKSRPGSETAGPRTPRRRGTVNIGAW